MIMPGEPCMGEIDALFCAALTGLSEFFPLTQGDVCAFACLRQAQGSLALGYPIRPLRGDYNNGGPAPCTAPVA